MASTPIEPLRDSENGEDEDALDSQEKSNELVCHEDLVSRSRENIMKSDIHVVSDQVGSNFRFNREVLEALFGVCPANYLVNFRNVCAEWNDAAFKAWRKVAQIRIGDYHEENSKKKACAKKLLNLPDLIRHIEDPNDPLKLNLINYRFQKYKLERWYLTEKNANMGIFWGIMGQSIIYLHLSKLRIKKMDTLLGILYDKVPNLCTLILENLYVMKSSTRCGKEIARFAALPAQLKLNMLKVKNLRSFPLGADGWKEFFIHFPGIEILESVNVKTDTDIQMMLQVVRTINIQEPADALQLKSLTIIRGDAKHRCVQQEFSGNMWQILRGLEPLLPLEELNLKLGCKTTRAIAGAILGNFAGSLRKLIFHVDFKCGNACSRFPYDIKFPLLEELKLWLWCKPTTNLHLLFKSMPNLKSLEVNGIKSLFGDSASFFKNALKDDKKDELVCSNLTDFSFTVKSLNIIDFNYLTAVARNITKLEVHVGDKIFRKICKHYPNLTELRVSGKGLTDEGVTGVYSKPWSSQAEVAKISDLKKLRVFVLHNLDHPLTDKSVFHGFLKLPSLFTLQMSLPTKQITQGARQELERNILNLVIMKSTGGKEDPGDMKEDEQENLELNDDEVSDDADWT